MKPSLNAWTVEISLGMEDTFRALSEAGFKGIELNVDAPGSPHALTMDTTEEDYEKIRGYIRKYNLPVLSISTSLAQHMSGTPSKHENYRQLIRKQIEAAKALGAKGILTAPAGMEHGITLKGAWDNSLDVFRSIKDEIDESGIIVGLENTWKQFFTSPYDMILFLDRLDAKNVGIYLDLGNIIALSEPEWWVEILGERIKFIHVKDFKRNGGPNTGGYFTDVTEGTANWPVIMKALKKTGFDGYITAEVFKSDENMPWDDYYKKVCTQIESIIAL